MPRKDRPAPTPPPHRMHVDQIPLSPSGDLVVADCPTCKLHATVVGDTGQAVALAKTIAVAHQDAEQARAEGHP